MKHLLRASVAGALLLSIPLTLRGQQPPVTRAPATAATIRATDMQPLRQWDDWLQRRQRDGTMRVRHRRADVMLTGREHERFQQYHGGVPVFGAGVTRQWHNRQVESIFGRVYDDLSIAVTPTVRPEDAAARAACARSGRSELVIYINHEVPTLTWRVPCYRTGDYAHAFVNAVTGDVEARITRMQTQSAIGEGRGVFFDTKKMSVSRQGTRFIADDALRPPRLWTLDLRGDVERAIELLNGDDVIRPSDFASDSDNIWEDGAVVDAHAYVGWTYDYLYKRFGRRSLDDHDAPLVSMVHPVTQTDALVIPEELLQFATNAFWCSGCGADGHGVMVFGDGIPATVWMDSGQTMTYFAGSLDIAAHELAHGLTDYTSGLIYEGESGALNEAFSDIIGTGVEFFYQAPGAAVRQADYLIGEDTITAYADGVNGARSMAVPTAFGDPDHYSERYRGSEDSGGVHTNSGIVNHAFYLAVEGGTHRLSGIVVPGVGADSRAQIERVFYRAFTLLLPANATFSIARAATIQAARDLYGANSTAERALAAAWTAVGVQ
jgi:thermolysin